MLYLASGLRKRGHGVDLVLRDLVCEYPGEIPDGVRMFISSRLDPVAHNETLKRLMVAPLPLVGKPNLQCRLPRLSLLGKIRRAQWPLLTSTSLPRWAVSMSMYLERERPDVLIASQFSSVAAAMMAVRCACHATRTVAVAHNILRTRRVWSRACRSFPYADAVVGISHGVANQLADIPGIARDRIHTIYNPVVPLELQLKMEESADHPWLTGQEVPLVLAIGRLVPQKDFATLLAAFARVRESRPVRLMILGKGKLRQMLLREAHQLGIAEHVAFPGFVDNPYSFLARASLFVLSSRFEGLSRVLIEAMACGCPVVSTNCQSGPTEILENGRWGELVPVGDSVALADAMIRTLDAPPEREALQKRASYFNIERAVSGYEALLTGDSRGSGV